MKNTKKVVSLSELAKPGRRYQRQVWLAVFSMLAFMVIYFALASWFGWTAYRLFADPSPTLGDVLVGGGCGFMAVFMLKALFFVQRERAGNALEVTQKSHPQLLAFIHSLADQVRAPRPKRVYLSPSVNARVFYDLSILNFIFPSKKNLEIGLGLVNVLTVSELKAVLAHEFGHFSQRSMAIGIWVYVAQQIAWHIVAKRDALDRLINFISNIHLYVSWIGWIVSIIVWSIRSVMDSLFRLVMIAQGSLSREMEFNADLVAVSVTGSDELVHALYKLQAADNAWERATSFAAAELGAGRAVQDIFDIQQRLIEKIAFILDDPEYGKAPAIPVRNREQHRVFKNDFVQPPSMWASHPSSVDREENAKRQYVPSQHDGNSAWKLFGNAQQLREEATAKLLAKPDAAVVASKEQSASALDASYALAKFDPRYRGAYLNRPLTYLALKVGELYDDMPQNELRHVLQNLYPPQLKEQLEKLRGVESELNNLQALQASLSHTHAGKILFRGREISRRALSATIAQVEQEVQQAQQAIFAHDKQCRSAHLLAAEQIGGGWRDYLIGLMAVLHFAEHTRMTLHEAYGNLRNVLAVVTTDGKVSGKEMKLVLVAANELYDVLEFIFASNRSVKLDEALCQRMKLKAWSDAFEEFSLTGAVKENVSQWLNVIDGWVNVSSYRLSRLAHEALEQLLDSELFVALSAASGAQPVAVAPAASSVPQDYRVMVPGSQRNYLKPSWWDRFYIGDGWAFGFIRLATAVCLVAAAIIYGSNAGLDSSISIYNGLSRPVSVHLPNSTLTLAPFSTTNIESELGKSPEITTTTTQDNQVIERFRPEVSGHGKHYVYNIAGASLLLEETIGYGVEVKQPFRPLDAARWRTYSANYFFEEPPKSIESKSGKETRT